MNDLEQFRATYISECFELLTDMEARLMGLDEAAVDREDLNAIFRCAHSIKGGSGAFGLNAITQFTHALEALLDAMRDGRVQATRNAIDTLLHAADIVTQMVQAAQENREPAAGLGADVKAELERLAAGNSAPSAPTQVTTEPAASGVKGTWHIRFSPHETLFASGNEPLLILRELARLGSAEITIHSDRVPPLEMIDATACYLRWSIQLITEAAESAIREVFEFVTDHCDLVVELQQPTPTRAAPQPDTVAEKPTATETAVKAGQSTSIRVDLEKIDRLVNMVGELVITEAMLRDQTRTLRPEQSAGLLRGIDELSHHTRELQEAVMSVRMQPVKSIFARMPRIVRDISAQLQKDIQLKMSGEQTEVDKTVIEQLADPLMHMIRNSCDHGIEIPSQRMALGKPAQGTIQLSAHHRGGRIILEIRDDGAGINRERVLAKAREKNLIGAEATPTPEEIDQMIFMAGFSTAETVTNVSGRGVGMDVVKRNIEGMGGTVRVTNMPGTGSLFTVSLPLTLAILDGMIVRVGSEYYIIPITSIIETLRPRSESVHSVDGHSDVINVRGEFISVIYLHRLFHIQGAETNPSRALMVLVEAGEKKLGLVVDELVGQQQVVIKSLEANADPVAGVSGATILGDGRVSLILEINDLTRLCGPEAAAQAQAA